MCLPYVCSLKVELDQTIPNDGQYHLVRLPYGVGEESYDAYGMHEPAQPDGSLVTNWATDDRSGLIWPHVYGWGTPFGMVQWEPGDYTETRDQIVRDPLVLADTTATEDKAPTPGGQYGTKAWGMFVYPTVPLGLRVRHNASSPKKVTLAEFKLAIHADRPNCGCAASA